MKKTLIPILFLILQAGNAQINLDWANKIGSTGTETGWCLETDHTGNTYITGTFSGTVDFDPGPGSAILSGLGIGDIFVAKYDPMGNNIWAKRMGGTDIDVGFSVTIDDFNNVYSTGFYRNTVDFDPGPGTYNLSSALEDIFIQKLDSNGNFIWARKISGPSTDIAYSINVDNQGNVYTSGYFQGTADFNPGAGIYNLTSAGVKDFYIQKLNSAGNFVWAKRIGNNLYSEIGYSIETDDTGSVYVVGTFAGTTDFDPGIDTFDLNGSIFILKLDSLGNFIWADAVGGGAAGGRCNMKLSTNGDILVGGAYTSTFDFDPGVGTYNLTSNGSGDVFLLKLNNQGVFAWAKSFGGIGLDECNSIDLDSSNNIYTTGLFTDTVDFNPEIGINNLGSAEPTNIYVARYNANGDYNWAVAMPTPLNSNGNAINIDDYGNVISTGYFRDSVDFDPDTSSYFLINPDLSTTDLYIQKLNQNLCSNFTLIIDSLSNITCIDSSYVYSYCIGGQNPYNYNWGSTPPDTDSLLNTNVPGLYPLTVIDNLGCLQTTSILVNGPLYLSSHELNINLVTNNFRPGTITNIWVDSYNYTCNPVSGQVIVVLDTILNFINSSPTPNTISGDSLIWDFTNINFDSLHLINYIRVKTPITAQIGDSVKIDIAITPLAGDADTLNNKKHYQFPIVNGYDPNDKKIYPPGQCAANYVINNQVLTYTIRFQNTGNDSAINIYILDTLDSHLDLNSIRVVGNSHPLITEVLPGNVIKFRFDNIMLPDSNANEPLSHGYVIFEVMPDSVVANNTPIENTSHIFFDFNAPVTTNTVHNTLVNSIPHSNQSLTQTACNSAIINGYSYNSSGIFTQYLNNHLGCDSVITINLTILDSSSSTLTTSNCISYDLNGTIYSTSGNYSQIIPNTAGCDSIITLQLTILDSSYYSFSASSCYTYSYNGNTYNNSGTYNQVFTNHVGCDSTVALYLTILDSAVNTINAAECNSYTLNGSTYNSSGTYYQSFTSSFGCDSTIIINLTINTIDNSVLQLGSTLTANQTSATYQWIDCNNSNLPIPGATNQTFTATANGNYAVIITSNGCTDTSVCQTVFGFGLESNELTDGLVIAPNPTTSIINISSLIELKDASIQLTNIDGQILIQKNQINGKTFALDLSELTSGMYFIQIYSAGKRGIVKVVKN